MPGAAIYSSLHLRKLLPAVILTFFLIVLMSACGNSPNVASLQKFDLDGVPAAPAWVAFKDGDGPWQQIATPSANLVWSHTVTDPAGRYAFAVVTASEQFLEIYAGTLSEISRFSALEFPTAIPATPVSVSGTVSGVPAGASWETRIGPRLARGPINGSAAFVIGVRTPGLTDMLAVRTAASGAMDRWWLNRNLPVLQNLTQTIDFTDPSLSDAGVATNVSLSISNLVAGGASYSTSHATISNGWGIASVVWLPSELWYLSPSAARMQPGDVQCVWGDTGMVRLTNCAAPGAALALDFTGLPIFGSVSLSGQTLSWSPYSGAQLYEVQLTPTTPTQGLYVDVTVTPGAAGTTPSLQIPDLSQVAGWKSSWTVNLGSATAVGWATASNVSTEQVLLQNVLNRYLAGYRGWVAVGLPLGLGGGPSVIQNCNVCLTNCCGPGSDFYGCVSGCNLLACSTDLDHALVPNCSTGQITLLPTCSSLGWYGPGCF